MIEDDGHMAAGRVNFDFDGRCLGVCFSRNESVCINGRQINEAAQKVASGQPLRRTRMGGTVKSSMTSPGVEVFRTQPGGILDKLGVKAGDTVISLNGYKTKNSAEFFRAIGYTCVPNITISIIREGKELTLSS